MPPSSRASQIPATPPTSAVTTDSGITSAAVSLVSCQLVAPRAVSSAVSPSRWAASSRATASSAATVSTSSSSALIASSDLATATLPPVSASTVGRLVVRVRPLSRPGPRSTPALAEMADRWLAVKSAMSGWATQVPVPTVSWPGNALGDTTSGP